MEEFFRRLGTDPSEPLTVIRKDGTTASEETIGFWLRRAREDNGAKLGLRDDVLSFTAMFIVSRLEDDLLNLGLRDPHVPVLEFLRHLRNAAAHGNRWFFTKPEPRNLAKMRNIEVTKSLHGQAAMYSGTVGPGDFLDLLEDVRVHLMSLP